MGVEIIYGGVKRLTPLVGAKKYMVCGPSTTTIGSTRGVIGPVPVKESKLRMLNLMPSPIALKGLLPKESNYVLQKLDQHRGSMYGFAKIRSPRIKKNVKC